MGFAEAVKSCFDQYVGFSGRARRSEYWWFYLFAVLVFVVTTVLDVVIGTGFEGTGYGWLTLVAALALLLPGLAVSIRRLHDTSRSGWWYLIGLVPFVGGIILLVFYCLDSHPDNKYGPSPKAVGAAPEVGPAPAM